MNTARIDGAGSDGTVVSTLKSFWTFDDADPLAVSVLFPAQGVTWALSLELLRQAMGEFMTSVGEGDVVLNHVGAVLFVDLRSDGGTAKLSFMAGDVEDFLSDVNDTGADEVVSAALDEWLETLA